MKNIMKKKQDGQKEHINLKIYEQDGIFWFYLTIYSEIDITQGES